MLHIVTGRAKSGKTTSAFEKIGQLSAQNKKSIYLVPEQFSFESERAMFFSGDPTKNTLGEVLSFTSLCRSIFAAKGGLAIPSLNTVAESVLMGVAFDNVKDQLLVYGGQSLSSNLLKNLIDTRRQCVQMGLTPDGLSGLSSRFGGDALQDKLWDFSALFAAFDALAQKNYTDEFDQIMRAVDRAQDYFDDKTLLIDNFTGFTKPQFDLLNLCMCRCEDVYVYLCCDDIYSGEISPFYETAKTARKLIQQAKKLGVPVAGITRLEHCFLGKQGLLALEQSLAGKQGKSQGGEGLLVLKSPDIFSEVRHIAIQIKKLVESGMRYRDIAVIVRDVQDYKTPISQIFSLYEIPVFLDQNQEIYTRPTVQFFTLVLQLSTKGFRVADVLHLLRLTQQDSEQVYQFENYVYRWNISGAAFGRDFVNNPKGFGAFDDQAKEQLEQINALRRRLIDPVIQFKKAAKATTGEKIVQALFALYETYDMAGATKKNISQLTQMGEEEIAQKQASQNSAALEVLDTLYTSLLGVPLSTARFGELLKLSLAGASYGVVPEKLDEVFLAQAGTSRVGQTKVCFVAGCSFGVFPGAPTQTGLLSDRDKDKLAHAGIEFANDLSNRMCDELYVCYDALTRASQQSILSYYQSGPDGETLGPSELVDTALQIEGTSLQDFDQLDSMDRVYSVPSAFETLCNCGDDTRIASLLCALGKDYTARYAQVLGSESCYRYQLEKQGASLLFPQKMNLSPSGLNQYLSCPFQFFLNRGLGLKPQKHQEISPLETGTFVHHILEQVIKANKNDIQAVSDQALCQQVDAVANDYIAQSFGTQNISQRQLALLGRIAQNSKLMVLRLKEELSQSKFTPAYFELKIAQDGQVPPMEILSPTGRTLSVGGIVDRVDTCQLGGETYVRVVDYKTGQKQLKLEDIWEGRDLQMLIYLFTLKNQQFGKEAGVLYLHSFVEYSDETDSKTKNQAKGILLNDYQVLSAMEQDLQGKFIFAKQRQNGEFTGAKFLATKQQFELLEQHTKHVLGSVADNLGQGKIQALPLQNGQFLSCTNCDYKSVCSIEDTDPVALPFKPDQEWDLYQAITQEEH